MTKAIYFKEPIVRPETGHTICIMEECPDVIDEAAAHCKETAYFLVDALTMSGLVDVMNGASPYFKGVAVCSPQDEFDEDTGISVAVAKACRAYHHRMANDYKKLIRPLQNAIDQLEPLMKAHAEEEAKLKKELEEGKAE